MDVRSRLSLSSSWQASEDLYCALYINSSSGILLDEPLSSQKDRTLLLLQPAPGEPCYLHIDGQRLGGYCPTAVEITSGSRTVEVYNEDEYIGTARGAFVGKNEDETKLYSCGLELPAGEVCSKLSLKLLSLYGKAEVLVERLQLTVIEDHGGTGLPSKPEAPGVDSQSDVQHLLDSLPSHNLPPFLTNLLTSLQHLQVQGPSPGGSLQQPLPPELSQVAAALRQMRPAPPEGDEGLEGSSHDAVPVENITKSDNGNVQAGDVHTDACTVDMAALERRLQKYIDEKFVQLQRQIDERFEELMKMVLDKRTL